MGWEYQEKGMKWFLSPRRGRFTIQGGKNLSSSFRKSLQLDPVLLAKRWTVFPGDEASAIPAELETEGEENNHETPFSSSNQADLGSGGDNPSLGPRRWEGAGAQEGEGQGGAAGASPDGDHGLSKLGDSPQRRVTRGTRCLVPGKQPGSGL